MKKILKRGFGHAMDCYVEDLKYNRAFYLRFCSNIAIATLIIQVLLMFFLWFTRGESNSYMIFFRYIYILSLIFPIYAISLQTTKMEIIKPVKTTKESLPALNSYWMLMIGGLLFLSYFYMRGRGGGIYQLYVFSLIGQWLCYVALLWMVKKNLGQKISFKLLAQLSFIIMIFSQSILFEIGYMVEYVFIGILEDVFGSVWLISFGARSIGIAIAMTFLTPLLVRLIYGISNDELDYEELPDDELSLNNE